MPSTTQSTAESLMGIPLILQILGHKLKYLTLLDMEWDFDPIMALDGKLQKLWWR